MFLKEKSFLNIFSVSPGTLLKTVGEKRGKERQPLPGEQSAKKHFWWKARKNVSRCNHTCSVMCLNHPPSPFTKISCPIQ